MTLYYEGDKRPEDTGSWARPISEAYEGTPKYDPMKPSEEKQPKKHPERRSIIADAWP